MHFQKPATTIEEQITLLRQRGMECADPELLKRWLETVGYYRLSAHWHFFEKAPTENCTRSKEFCTGTQFESVVSIYVFDRKLRLMVMEAVERIEISVRSRWTNRFSLMHGAHGYLEKMNFSPNLNYPEMTTKIANNVKRSNESFIKHYSSKYTQPKMPPIWMATETMSFGELSKWVARTANNSIKSGVAKDIGLSTINNLDGTLQALAFVRNICAHHGRLWNRKLVKRCPNIKKFRHDMVIETIGDQHQADNRIYNVLIVLMHLMIHQSRESTFPRRLCSLIKEVTDEQRQAMGFPENWKDRPIWKSSLL